MALISVSWLMFSCSGSDDGDMIVNESPESPESVIIYTDLEPDFISDDQNQSYDIDLNNDGKTDFILNKDGGEYLALESQNYTNGGLNNGVLSISPFGTYVIPVGEGSKIPRVYNSGESFSIGGYILAEDCESCEYNWKDQDKKFIAIKLIIEGKVHYAWVQLYVEGPTQWTVKDYAFNATPDIPILAGQTE
ncbi:hypothetical protein E7Z59_13160 [Robertkochia marina]|uniref:Uncharacterized protein n=1 Tax=Robertkochia marina TaxID=1227945 RepID=A0A4S3LZJ1_9FLAO|nr:hypothetical protein [Robertkochia marina]THD66725.1 hypothetical protein E7Z59_13160 [Robertkochia marina]